MALPNRALARRRKRKREENVDPSKIDELPDDVLVSILSRLTMKEAAITSLLSRRWRRLWFQGFTCLNFDASLCFFCLERNSSSLLDSLREERDEYARLVNLVLKSFKGLRVDEFHVRFDLDTHHGRDIDKWVKFAVEKQVKSLVLDFRCCFRYDCSFPYIFPLTHNNFKWHLRSRLPVCTSLRFLELRKISLTQAVIDYLLSTCSYLEELTMQVSDLDKLSVVGEKLRLKRLTVVGCNHLKSIHLSSTLNLTSFYFDGPTTDIVISHVPSLIQVSAGYRFSDYIISNYRLPLNFMFQLETLKLTMKFKKTSQETLIKLREFPLLSRLKNLTLGIFGYDDDSILVLAHLLKAAPSLRKLVLEKYLYFADTSIGRASTGEVPKYRHQCLNIVEILGFTGKRPDIEICKYLIANTAMLEKLILDPILSKLLESPFPLTDCKCRAAQRLNIEATRVRAMQLQSESSLGDKFQLRNFSTLI